MLSLLGNIIEKEMLNHIKEDCRLLRKLVKNDLKTRYSGSIFGIVWAFVQPLVTILVFWYVFQLGFKNPPVDNIEFILWYVAAFIPWTFFNDGLMSSSNVFYEYSYLVKKIKFKQWMLPLIKVFSSVYIHLFFIGFIYVIYMLYGYSFGISWLSVFYYSFALMILLIGLAYAVSSAAVFMKDASQIVNIVLQIVFWITPIFWADSVMQPGVLKILKLNPLYYIINGYRDAMIYGVNFWEEPVRVIAYYWCLTIVVLFLGIKTYRKLKVHFADLL